MNAKHLSTAAKTMLILVGLLAIGASTGCDQLLYPDWTDWYYPQTYYPPTTYYDPTELIQGAVDYRLDAMETAANGWDEFIRQ